MSAAFHFADPWGQKDSRLRHPLLDDPYIWAVLSFVQVDLKFQAYNEKFIEQ